MASPRYITFDCYGTLVNFDLTPATLRVLGARTKRIDLNRFFDDFEAIRFQQVLGPYRPYREVLCRSLEEVMTRFELEYRSADGDEIVHAVPTFGPFPDVPDALARLRGRFKLVIISNTDDDLIVHNVRNIGVPFDHVITAEQARAYKPSHRIFHHALDVLGCGPEDILHVAQGFEYDIVPAHELGWSRVWINRYGQPGDQAYGPYIELPDLSSLPPLLGISRWPASTSDSWIGWREAREIGRES
ncbi:MAG: haloacid dehalogenase type II [bacterium]